VRALLDTCVLLSSLGRDLLLSIAVENVYVPYWSDAILAELGAVIRRTFAAAGRDADAAGYADHLLREMNRAFPDASVPQRYEALVGTFGLPDPDDEHVVTAAVVCGATTIVSDNVKDIPVDRLPDHIHVLPAREFINGAVGARRAAVRRAIGNMAQRHRIGAVEMIGLLEKKQWLGHDAADTLRAIGGRSGRDRTLRDPRGAD